MTPDRHTHELGEILTLLNPPRQEYDLLATSIHHFLAREQDIPPTIRMLAIYFKFLGYGYAEWQTCYDYPIIHEYFYAGYLCAFKEQEGAQASRSLQELIDMLYAVTQAMIAYTWCEKAILCSDPKALTKASAHALHYSARAVAILKCLNDQQVLSVDVYRPIAFYLQIHAKLFRGFQLCGPAFLTLIVHRGIVPASFHTRMHHLLEDLKDDSLELFTELRTQYRALCRLEHIVQQHPHPRLIIRDADVHLRTIGYLDEKTVTHLFSYCDGQVHKGAVPASLAEMARKYTGMDIELVYEDHLPDLVETTFGEEYLRILVFEFNAHDDADQPQLRFYINDGFTARAFAIDSFSIRISRMGAVALHFLVHVQDASVATTRTLKSLIAPGAGRFDFVWLQHAHLTRGTEQDVAPTNFIEYYMRCRSWVTRAQQATPQVDFTEPWTILEEWRCLLMHFSEELPLRFGMPHRESLEDHEPLRDIYMKLGTCYERMQHWGSAHLQRFDQLSATTLQNYADLRLEGQELFPNGVHFTQLTNIAQEIFHRLEAFIQTLSDDLAVRSCQIIYDPDIQWQSILFCRELTLVDEQAQTHELSMHFDTQQLVNHPEFKGLLIPPTTVRSIYDWMFTNASDTIRVSTHSDYPDNLTFVDQNNIVLYWPGEPHYITEQIIGMAGLVGDTRALIITLGQEVERQIDELRPLLLEWHDNMMTTRSYLIERRTEINTFKVRARRLLDKLLASTTTKYQDTSNLMQSMMHASTLEELLQSLERKFQILDQLEHHLTDLIDREVEDRVRDNQKAINNALFLITVLQAISVIPAFIPAFFEFIEDGEISRYTIAIAMLGVLLVITLFLVLPRKKQRKQTTPSSTGNLESQG